MKSLVVCLLSLLVSASTASAEAPTVSGHVRLVDGSPVAGAQVLLFDVADLQRGALGQATTDADGQFALPLGSSALPTRFGLGQNYPNPFNPGTVIPYQLAADGHVRLEVFNLLGQRVATLVEGEMAAGSYTAVWDARDGSGYGVAAGVYVYRLTAGDAMATRRMVLVDGPAGGPVSVAGPVSAAADVATDAAEYGLTVSGVGLATYVDAAFVVGDGPVDVVVEASTGSASVGSAGRGKAAAGGILGDVDGDGRVDVADALVVAAYSVNATGLVPQGGDVDGDGEVNGEDARLLALYSVDPGHPGLPVGIGLPVGASVVGRVPSLVRGGEVVLSSVDGQVLAETTTDDAGDGFAFAVRPDGLPAWVLVTAVGGVGLDANGDGVVDRGPMAKPGRLRAWVGREYVAAGEALVVNPLTEMAYHALGSRYGEDLSGLAGEEVAAALDSIAQDFLVVEGATYGDLLSFDPAADQGLLRVSWGVLQRQVVVAMNEGAGDAELARRVELVWQRPKAAGVTATAEVVEKVAFVGARQILTNALADGTGFGVGILHQAYIDDASGALVEVFLTKTAGNRSSVHVGIFKAGNRLSISGVSDILDGVPFTESGLREFVPSIIDVVPDGASQLRIILDKGLSARLSDQELVFRVNGQEPTASQLEVIEDDPVIRWDFGELYLLNAAELLEFYDLEFSDLEEELKPPEDCPQSDEIKYAYQNGFVVLEMSTPTYDCLSGMNEDLGERFRRVGPQLLSDTGLYVLGAVAVGVGGKITAITGGAAAPVGAPLMMKGALIIKKASSIYSFITDVQYILGGVSDLIKKNFSSTKVDFVGEFTEDGKMSPGVEYVPVLKVRSKKRSEKTIELKIVGKHVPFVSIYPGDGRIFDEISLGSLRVKPDRGYFIIPPNPMILEVIDSPSSRSKRSAFFVMDTEGFWDDNVTFDIAERSYLPKFTVLERSNASEGFVFLDASPSVLPDNASAEYQWVYYDEQGTKTSLGTAQRLKVPISFFDGLVDGQGVVVIQLDVTIGFVTETVRRTVRITGESSWNEEVVDEDDYVPVEPPIEEPIDLVVEPPIEEPIDLVAGEVLLLTDRRGDDESPAWSPDGKHIAFVSNRDGNENIYVIDSDGKNDKRLTDLPDDDTAKSFVWSPDGKRIAFVAFTGRGHGYDIFVMDRDGSNLTRLANGDSPTWSPDGKYIAYRTFARYRQSVIFMVDSDGKDHHYILGHLGHFYSPVWAPLGGHIAFVYNRDGNENIYVMDSDGKNDKRLTDRRGDDRSPAWSPDGKHIAFVSNRDGNRDIYVMDRDGSNLTRLTNHRGDDESPAWSPNGKHIAFVSNRDGNRDIYVMDRDGSNLTRLTNHRGDDESPAWSPDGEHIAFVSARYDRNRDIYVIDLAGSTFAEPVTGDSTDEVREFSLPGGASMEFVWIEPGVFQMGSPDSELGRRGDEDLHEVEISQGFYLGKYEVTQGQWEAVMGETPWAGGGKVLEHPSHPAVYISWYDVQRFIDKLNAASGSSVYRLPSGAEWEYACRAGTQTRWSFGDDVRQLEDYAWYNACDVGECYARAVGMKRPNPWGLYDMHGNVWEWVQDDYSYGSYRVMRGGDFNDGAQYVRSAYRGFSSPDGRYTNLGVRLVRSEEPIEPPTQVSETMAFVWIEPGVFQMGSPESEEGRWDDEGPLHEVELSRGFWLGKYEVTQGEWESVMGDNPSYFEGDARRPVDSVSWYDVHEFIGRLNDAAGDSLYRLPTEAEWEYACRAGTSMAYGYQTKDPNPRLGDYAWYDGSHWGTKVVGGKLPNDWGLHDMHGNVWEWVQDWYGSRYYNDSPRVDPLGPISGSERVRRGGGFLYAAQDLRSAGRGYSSPDNRLDDIGVRLVRIR